MIPFHEGLYQWSRWAWPLVANHLWQASLFSLLPFLSAALLKRGPARLRYAIWLAASVKFVVPSALFIFAADRLGFDLESWFTSSLPQSLSSPLAPQVAAPILQLTDTLIERGSITVESSPAHSEIYCVLTLVWAAGCALLLARWWQRRREFALALQAGTPVTSGREADALARVRTLIANVSVKRLVISAKVTEPGICRTFRPILALPGGLAEHLSDAELDAVLMHELVHASRRDNMVSNLQMLLCCLFWFHPLVWLIDRRLLIERERACDEKVMQLGAPAKVYAATLLKVLRFCMGWKVAGVSSATGSNMQKRVEAVMTNRVGTPASLTHRFLVAAVAAVLVVFSVATGLLSADAKHSAAFAQTKETSKARGSAGAAAGQDRLAGRDLTAAENASTGTMDSSTPAPGEAGLFSGQDASELMKEADQAPYTDIRFENVKGAPVSISEARVKVVLFAGRGHASTTSDNDKVFELITEPSIRLANNTNRPITVLRMSFQIPGLSHDVTWHSVFIEPHGSYVLRVEGRNWANTGPPGSAKRLTVKVIGLRYEDGESWGEVDPQTGALAPPAESAPAAPAIAATPPSPATQPARSAMQGEPRPPFAETAPPSSAPAMAATPQPPLAILAAPQPGRAGTPASTPRLAPAAPQAAPELSPAPAAPAGPGQPRSAAPAYAAPRALTYPPLADSNPPALKYVPAKYINPSGAPLIIMDARTGIEAQPGTRRPTDWMSLPVVTLTNSTNRRITAVKVRFKWNKPEHAVAAREVSIEPGASYVLRSGMEVFGDPEGMRVQVIGVQFEDGSVWGSMNSTIDSSQDWIQIRQ